MNITYYTPPNSNLWQGRIDLPKQPDTLRWHQQMQFIDLQRPITPNKDSHQSFALIGFSCDEGVARNLGRIGSKDGPNSIRKALANLPWHGNATDFLFDAGDIVCNNHNLEEAQKMLAQAVSHLLQNGFKPIVLGGGHEVAFGHFMGIVANQAQAPAIINFDAHFDLRTYEQGSHSGSGFLQMADYCLANQKSFSYFCLGIQKSANTKALFHKATELNVQFLKAKEMQIPTQNHFATLKDFCDKHDSIYLTICLDVFAAAFAPGVSAPSALGIYPSQALGFLDVIFQSKKVISFDIAELSPPYDQDSRTAKLAAQLIFYSVSQILDQKKP